MRKFLNRAIIAAVVIPSAAFAQTPTLRIEAADRAAAAGTILFQSQGQNAVLSVVATDESGRRMSLASTPPVWSVDNEAVVSFYGETRGETTRIVAGNSGRAIVTVRALGQTASIPVAVGAARLVLTAGDVAPDFQVVRLEIVQREIPSGEREDKLSGSALLLGENGHNIMLLARAFNSAGRAIPLDTLPVTWSTGNADVVELDAGPQEARATGRGSGQTTITAAIQGLTVTLTGYVGDARSHADPALFRQEAVATGASTVAARPVMANPARVPVDGVTRRAPTSTTPTQNPREAVLPEGVRPAQPMDRNKFNYISGVLGDPALPAPSYKIVDFSRASVPQNDPMVNTVRLEVTPPADWQSCPYTPMFHWDEGMPAVPAAHYSLGSPDSDPPQKKYIIIGKAIYFRPPVIPGQVLVKYPQVNSRVYLVNCRNEYSNALNFTIEPPEPTTFQITTFYPQKITPGVKVIISGYMLAAWDTTTQKVFFSFKLGKNNATNTGLDVVYRDVQAGYDMLGTSYSASVFAPALEGLGYDPSWVILEASLYVVKSGLRSNALPIKYCSSANGPTPSGPVMC